MKYFKRSLLYFCTLVICSLISYSGEAQVINPGSGTVKTCSNEGTGSNVCDTTNSSANNLVFKSMAGTANQVSIAASGTTLTLSTPQNINSTATPTFSGLTLSTTPLALTSGGVGASTAAGARTTLGLDTASSPTFSGLTLSTTPLALTSGGVGASTAAGARTTLGLGSISTQASTAVSITGGAIDGTPIGATTPSTGKFSSVTNTALTANAMIYSNASSAIISTAAPTNGQILIGSTGAAPAIAAISGTTNQVNVTNGAGTITLATPQNIDSTATPQFAKVLIGSSSLTSEGPALLLAVDTPVQVAPGAAGAKLIVRCGTNAGTVKLLISAGTSATSVLIVDNVGAGVTGC